MAKRKERPFDKLYAELEEIKDARGEVMNTVLFSKNGNWSVIIEIENPIQQYCTDAELYYSYADILSNIIQTLGEGYCIQKQDVFCKQGYNHAITDDMSFLYKSYFNYFKGRDYTNIRTFLIITQEFKQSSFVKYDPKAWLDFHSKVGKVINILSEKNIPHYKLNKKEVAEYVHRFLAFDFKPQPFSLNNMNVTDEYIKSGERAIKSFSLVNIDTIDLPTFIRPFNTMPVNGFNIATDLLSFLADIPSTDCVIYNQVIQIPQQRPLMRKLQSKAKRHDSMPDPSNKIAKADIDLVLDLLAKESKLLVYCNFNIITSCPLAKINDVSSFLETKLYDCGIMPSKACYNQLELFANSFPGMSYSLNKEYDLFLTLADAAICLFYKEHMKHSEESRLNVYYTDRQGIPVSIDITGKEGKIKMTDNANFFCLGPSGSGKSFHMNSVVAQLLMQDTDVVMIDTGDSYEGISHYFHGTYITYSKEKPISMNPFSITTDEYNLNFGEKKQFLKSLIFLIFKGNEEPTKIEDKIINQTLVEYYEEYFHPFEKFSEKERERLRERLLLEEKKNGEFDKYEQKLEEKYGDDYRIDELEGNIDDVNNDNISEETNSENNADDFDFTTEEKNHHAKVERQVNKLRNIVNDKAASDGEKQNANRQLIRLMPELIEGKYLMRIEKKIDRMEKKRRKLHVTNLSFNTYYEFALERIPQIMAEKKIDFDIDDFAAILEQFYKGGELEHTLNNDLDKSLFDEKFIVFEIDKIKDDPILFPIVVLIIMDVFLQKMRLKKGRKALIIEEAWKAISSPTMAGYIKYLYKTVRKFNGIAGVVTQELNDVIDSPIVKEAIINNSDVKILLDQSKFKDRYEDISAILGLTDVQRQQIFTVNALPPKEGIPYHKEVWISRGQYSDVYSVEVPPEWYWAFTTERVEKEALKVYERVFNDDIEQAIAHIEADRKAMKISRYFDFAVLVNKHQNIMSLWNQ
ncbi:MULTISPECIES: TraG family conjugative transposon ATPase [Prevotella]|jgi:conjugation system ATPase, TraG family|nr:MULTISPECIES: TraG family conjugative transposon ATPase [Prevotella]MBF1645737.1 TraG family conjugative transposon ATPase [Prevotella sp.]ATV39374.1 TraG family conjugative transposon ATPase [Prevotella intermedia]MBW4715300.1 TraG family conjugative transposon ATPase [Prevotella denticola]MBW4753052.1 TraG family conjugative transposon ATPase [Prevotella denticola]MBW4760711.1 TraG family conjugative transposon ATPase [Prevotella denticola]